MITEDYVSFEVAKLLKEKGFDWECIGYYVDDEPNDIKYSFLRETNSTWESRCCSCPSQSMAMKWLREMRNIFIVIDRHYFVVDRISHIASGFKYSIEIKTINTVYTYNDYKSYEEAVEAALKYVLENLI